MSEAFLQTDHAESLTPASPEDLGAALAFALRFDGRKRKHDAAEMMARIVGARLVERLERAGFVIMKRPPAGGASAIGREPRDKRALSRDLNGAIGYFAVRPPPQRSLCRYRSPEFALVRRRLSGKSRASRPVRHPNFR